MRGARLGLLALLSALAACGGGAARQAAADSAARAAASAPPSWPDSLALSVPGGIEVWYTAGRTAKKADGTACVERVMEVRRDGKRLPVPLLYTGERPTIADDTSFFAHIWLDCEPGNLYQVSLRTGQPTYLGRVKTPGRRPPASRP